MVAAVVNPKTTSSQPQEPTKRHPLLLSDSQYAPPRRPKSRHVTSRYLLPSSSSTTTKTTISSSSSITSTTTTSSATSSTPRRSASPSSVVIRAAASTTPSSTIHRPRVVSVERKRPATPRPGGDVSSAQRMLIASARSLSASFQGESLRTPERRTATPVPTRRVERCPGRLRSQRQLQPNCSSCLSKSVDFCAVSEWKKTVGSKLVSRASGIRVLHSSALYDVDDDEDKIRTSNKSRANSEPEMNGSERIGIPCSDTESVSSSSTSTFEGDSASSQQRGVGFKLCARSAQETCGGVTCKKEPISPLASKIVGLERPALAKLVPVKKLGVDGPAYSLTGVVNGRGLLSPLRSGGGALRPASPSKMLATRGVSPARVRSAGGSMVGGSCNSDNFSNTLCRSRGALRPSSPSKMSAIRGMSPTRIRSVVGSVVGGYCNSENLSNNMSVLSYAADVRRGKSGKDQIVDVHILRLLYNWLLQWRFINARADSTLLAQRLNAERTLYNAHIATSNLSQSVRAKRTELQQLRQNLKLASILKGQIVLLEEWALMDQDYTYSLSGATEALQASTLRLPVVAGARVDVISIKDALCSAVDVMQAMASSICILLSKVGEANSLVSELVNVTTMEHALLDQCEYHLSTIAALQAKECSRRTHMLQQMRTCSTPTLKM